MPTLIHPIIAIVAGLIILIYPQILNYVIGIYLILAGILSLVGTNFWPS